MGTDSGPPRHPAAGQLSMGLRLTGRQRYFLVRLSWYLLALIAAVTLTFLLPRLGSTSPVDSVLASLNTAGMSAAEVAETRAEFTRAFHLDEPVWRQYLIYLGRTLTGDLGFSAVSYPNRCWEMVSEKLPWSLLLILPTIVLAWILGNILGTLAAYKRGVFDRLLFPLAQFVGSIPFFCFGLLLVFVFYSQLAWVDELGAYSAAVEPSFSLSFAADVAAHYFLPFASIFFIVLGGQAVGMRSLCIYELDTDYVRYAKALGIVERKIVYYVFRNAILPQLTGLALILGTMIGGTLITEIIFSYPGLGTMMLRAITTNDYPLIQAIALLVALIVLALNFAVDLAIGLLDPRIKAGEPIGDRR